MLKPCSIRPPFKKPTCCIFNERGCCRKPGSYFKVFVALGASSVSMVMRQYPGLVLDESTLCKERGGHPVEAEGT